MHCERENIPLFASRGKERELERVVRSVRGGQPFFPEESQREREKREASWKIYVGSGWTVKVADAGVSYLLQRHCRPWCALLSVSAVS